MWQSENLVKAPLACLACKSRRGREETTMVLCLLIAATFAPDCTFLHVADLIGSSTALSFT